MRELRVAKEAMKTHAARPALASLRRAAGMGWNAVLALEADPDAAFGRSYADHLRAIADGASPSSTVDATKVPEEVREAARRLMDDPVAQRADVVPLLTPRRDEQLVDAAETILAEAYARVLRRGRDPSTN